MLFHPLDAEDVMSLMTSQAYRVRLSQRKKKVMSRDCAYHCHVQCHCTRRFSSVLCFQRRDSEESTTIRGHVNGLPVTREVGSALCCRWQMPLLWKTYQYLRISSQPRQPQPMLRIVGLHWDPTGNVPLTGHVELTPCCPAGTLIHLFLVTVSLNIG